MNNNENIQRLPLNIIQMSPLNPRKTMSQEGIVELADSIKQIGLLQPITVRPVEFSEAGNEPTRYEVVIGERRYRALSIIGVEEAECIVRTMTDEEAKFAMIVENLQRKDVDPFEEGEALTMLNDSGRMTIENLAIKFGKSATYISDRICMCRLPNTIKMMARSGRIPLTAAVLISKASKNIIEEFEKIYGNGTSTHTFREVKNFVKNRAMLIEDAIWSREGVDKVCDWHLCANCPHNTGNQGSLFHEFSDESACCTNSWCYERKQQLFIMEKLRQYLPMLVQEDEYPEPDLYCVLNPENEDIMSFLKKNNVRVFSESDFAFRVYDTSNIEKLNEDIREYRVARVIRLQQYGVPTFSIEYYRFRSEERKEKSIEQIKYSKADRLRTLERDQESKEFTTAMRVIQRSRYSDKNIALTATELSVIDAIMLAFCSENFRKNMGDATMEYVDSNNSESNRWRREFISEILTNLNICPFNPITHRAIVMAIAKEQMPGEYKKEMDSLHKSFAKKRKRIEAEED